MEPIQGGFSHPLTRQWNCVRPLTKDMFMYPVFFTDTDQSEDISSLPGQRRWAVEEGCQMIGELVNKGLRSVILFGVPVLKKKDPTGTLADDKEGPVIMAIRRLRELYPDLYIAADVCLCEYTSHGHCGIFGEGEQTVLDNERSTERIAEVALAYAQAGAHCIAPSDMNDDRILAIHEILVMHSLRAKVTLMSYAAKFATCLYGPFRDAADSAPQFGDRKTYQFPPQSNLLPRRAILRDATQGADIVMVKPSLYLDIVQTAATETDLPVAVYQVSGEFAMIHAAAEKGVVDLKDLAFEYTQGAVRAGATIILSYFTPQFLEWLPI